VIQAMTAQVAEALDRARLFEEMELAREQMNALYSGSEQVVRARTIEEVLHALVDATPLKRVDRVNFMFFDKVWTDEEEATMVTVTAVWEKSGGPSLQPVGTQYLISQLPGNERITGDKPAIFSNIAADAHIDAGTKARASLLGINSVIFFPLLVGDQWFGLLSAQSFSPLTLSKDDIRQITSLVDQAASVSQTQQLFAQARERAQREQLLREVTAKVYAAPDAESILKTAVKEVNRILGVDSFIYLDDQSGKQTTSGNGRHLEQTEIALGDK
jgi:GAF domain-containing protein